MLARMALSIKPRHFDRWLALLQQTTANVCPPPAALIFLENARRIADSFEMAMATQRGRIAGPRHLRRS
jgi:hemoglobin